MKTSFRILILGYGEMGHAMTYLLKESHSIDVWEKFPQNNFTSVVLADSVPYADIILFCLPVNPHREVIQQIAPLLQTNCLCISIAKGLDESGKTAAQIFAENLPIHQPHALLYGPMIAEEIRAGRYAFAQLGSRDTTAFHIVQSCFQHTHLRLAHTFDIPGISWSVILKNVYAMAFGMADALELGDNVRGYLAVTALQELSQIVQAMGGGAETPYHLAGLGDLITTATSESSHHHELGCQLARGQTQNITGEGPHTLEMIDRHHLIDIQRYPLFQLIDEIVMHPHDIRSQFIGFLERTDIQQAQSIQP